MSEERIACCIEMIRDLFSGEEDLMWPNDVMPGVVNNAVTLIASMDGYHMRDDNGNLQEYKRAADVLGALIIVEELNNAQHPVQSVYQKLSELVD